MIGIVYTNPVFEAKKRLAQNKCNETVTTPHLDLLQSEHFSPWIASSAHQTHVQNGIRFSQTTPISIYFRLFLQLFSLLCYQTMWASYQLCEGLPFIHFKFTCWQLRL